MTPVLLDNYLFSTSFSAGKDAYNLKGFRMSHGSDLIVSFKVNPAGYSYAVLSIGKRRRLTVYDMNVADHKLAETELAPGASAICYTADSRGILVAEPGRVVLLDSRTLAFLSSFAVEGCPKALFADPEGALVGCVYDSHVDVYNARSGALRKSLPVSGAVVEAKFSPSGDALGILSTGGTLLLYNTFDFGLARTVERLGDARSFAFHPDNKYVAAAVGGRRVQFVNITDDSDRPVIDDVDGPISYVRFLSDGRDGLYVSYDANKAVKYKRITGFIPNYTKLMREELNERMREWTKMRPMESDEEYAMRVNEESIERQKKLFANEIATSLAGDLVSHGEVTLGRYNPQSGQLTLSIGSLPAIYLQVPQEDMASFGNGADLRFSNAVYGITADDTFELIYVDVYSPSTGKSYTFDNLDRQNLDFLLTDDSFVSLDLIKHTTREDVVLKGIKDSVVKDAMNRNLISEHTRIDVDTHIEPSYDSDGRRINNYNIAFSYSVDAEFSEREDFPAGKYRMEESNAASSMLAIIRQAFESDFAAYVKPGARLVVRVTGSADAMPVNRVIAYDGALGDFENEPARVDGDLIGITVTRKSGIRNNEQLAFMRAQALAAGLRSTVSELDSLDTDYRYFIELAKERGGAFRRIKVDFTFVDAF
ncbi:MAG: hypothetical protein NC418_06195 [Muribaculaceae bacterium]|nr:hypothetical protein [Muribaculaceae bacterium]